MGRSVPAKERAKRDRTPAPVAAKAEVVDLGNGQAALFDDPLELRKLPDAELAELTHRYGKQAGGAIRQLRRGFGLLAWEWWHRLDEAAYGQWLEDYAAVAGVEQPATLKRWRDAVVRTDNLPVPAVAQLRRQERAGAIGAGKTAGQAGGQTIFAAPAPPSPAPLAATAAELPMGGEPAPTPATTAAPKGPPPPAAAPVPEQASPAVLEVRGLVGRITTTSAEVLATACTLDAVRQARQRLNEAQQIIENRIKAAARKGCDHAGAPLKKLAYGTFCGTCGEKVR